MPRIFRRRDLCFPDGSGENLHADRGDLGEISPIGMEIGRGLGRKAEISWPEGGRMDLAGCPACWT